MPIVNAYAYLIHPGKRTRIASSVSGKELVLGSGKLFEMLAEIFEAPPSTRDFEITFNAAPDGAKTNECRTLMINFQSAPSLQTGGAIADRLQGVTDNRSGIGLLFLMAGHHGTKPRMVVSRFPTDQAILAEIGSDGLGIEFLEQVFIKRLSAYKALLLEHPDPKHGFWSGIATDRQAGQSGEHISEYWLRDFLNADFSETPAAGTRRLAAALKEAIRKTPNLQVKSEIASASSLARSVFSGKSLSIESFCSHFGFSKNTIDTIKAQLLKKSSFSKTFSFDIKEFKKTAPYRTVEMDTGAILTAPNDEFDSLFQANENKDGIVEYKTQGRVNDQRLARR